MHIFRKTKSKIQDGRKSRKLYAVPNKQTKPLFGDSLSCSPQFDKMAENLVNCTQYQTNKLNPTVYR